MHAKFCLHKDSKTGVCFPQSSGSSINNPAGPQGQIPWGFPVPLSDLQAGKPDEPSKQFKNFFGFIVLGSVGHPPSGYGIWFYHDCTPSTISLWLLCFLTWVSLFDGFQHPPVKSCSTASCNFCAIPGDKCISFYSTVYMYMCLRAKSPWSWDRWTFEDWSQSVLKLWDNPAWSKGCMVIEYLTESHELS